MQCMLPFSQEQRQAHHHRNQLHEPDAEPNLDVHLQGLPLIKDLYRPNTAHMVGQDGRKGIAQILTAQNTVGVQ